MMFTVKEGSTSLPHHSGKGKLKVAEVICYINIVEVRLDGMRIALKVRVDKQEGSDKKGREKDKGIKKGGDTKILHFNCQQSSLLVDVLRAGCGHIFASHPTNMFVFFFLTQLNLTQLISSQLNRTKKHPNNQHRKPSFPIDPSAFNASPIPEPDPATASHLLFTYRAYCVQTKTRISPEFLRFIEDLIAISSTELPLSECPGVFAKSSITPSLHPAFQALAHNTHFKSCHLVDSANKDVVPEMAATILRFPFFLLFPTSFYFSLFTFSTSPIFFFVSHSSHIFANQ